MKVRETEEKMDLSRRRLLKALGIGGAALPMTAVASNSVLAAIRNPNLREAEGILTGAHWGPFRAVVKDGKFVEAIPLIHSPADDMIRAIPDQVYSPTRVKYPHIRRGFLEKRGKADPSLRGRDEWVRVSWEQALDIVASEIQRVRTEHGGSSILAGLYGWKSVGLLHNSRNAVRRLMYLGGGCQGYFGDYSTGAAQIIMPHVMGALEVYDQQTVWPAVLANSQFVVIFGADPYVTLKNSWNIPDFEGYNGFDALKAKGIRVVTIDPVHTDTAKQLNAEWLPVRQRTDVALMLGLMHTLYTEKLYDAKFLKTYTVGFPEIEAYLVGKEDGVAKTPEWASGLCGIPADKIRALAREMAAKRTMLMAGWSIQRQQHGEQAHWMLVTLAAMLGQIGLPGGGIGFSYHYASGGSPTARGGMLKGLGAGTATGPLPPPIPAARIFDCLMNPGKTINVNGKDITYPDIKMIYWAGGNPFHHHQDINQLVRSWQHRPEVVIVHEPYWTATAKHADIVLPATTSYERNDLEMGGDYSAKYIFPMHKVIDPIGESRNDFDICADIAERLGYRSAYTEDRDEMQWLKDLYKGATVGARASRVALPPFELFWKSGDYVEFPIPDSAKTWVRHADFRGDPLLNPLGTPSGLIELFSKKVAGMGYADCAGHARWYEPIDWHKSDRSSRYPLSLISSHPSHRLHSQLSNAMSLRKTYAVDGREPLLINTQDAAARGIKSGDVVRVFNDLGQVLAGAVVTDDIMPGAVRLSEGGWYDPAEPGVPGSLCKNGSVNVLVRDIPTSGLAMGNCGQSGIVQVERYTGPKMPVTAFEPPKGAVS
ncbi:trimethylamine-N-oxide reductase TorA [Azospirillum sp. CFH 70021]|uniref:Dimethyl sulfoxide/trimethylamine N-oxide reductase n=1 Tax=Azospirillum thermophilum TaxID=2202148 RepID=A0A2S2CY68_9PROT|nr:trimethylamine-N-oxide reductase TorA [Azospirillum thermophilum]